MVINEHYNEVMDVIDKLFVYIFSGLNAKYGTLPALVAVLFFGSRVSVSMAP